MWYQLQIEQCHRDEVDPINEALEETGTLSITLTDKNDEPIMEPKPGTTPLWQDVIINALYTSAHEAELAKLLLTTHYPHLSFSIRELIEKNWERAWMDDFKPQCFGQRLWVCPSWLEPPDPKAVNLILDPGLAFGTGTHPTTSLCLRWLDEADLNHKTVIDYGCGSGILALAALKLGAAKVQAVDIDEQAIQATKSNALINGINPQQLQVSFPQSLRLPVDAVIANILLAPLLDLRFKFRDLLKNQGILVVSGILNEQAASLIEAYQADFRLQSSMNLEGWSLLTFIRQEAAHE